MLTAQPLKDMRKALGIRQSQIAEQMGVARMTYCALENSASSTPRQSTVENVLCAFNAILSERGSDRRLTYDEIWNAILVSRGQTPVAAGLTAVEHLHPQQ